MKCSACFGEIDLMGIATGHDVCLDCVKARHRAVLTHKCSCGKKRRESEVKRIGSRTWISCHRCLAQVRQLS